VGGGIYTKDAKVTKDFSMVLRLPLSPSLSPQARREGIRYGVAIVRADAWARRPYVGRGWRMEMSLLELGNILVVADLQPLSRLWNL
jgi:hypothetical protein